MNKVKHIINDVLNHNNSNAAIIRARLVIVEGSPRSKSSQTPIWEDNPTVGEIGGYQEKEKAKCTTLTI